MTLKSLYQLARSGDVGGIEDVLQSQDTVKLDTLDENKVSALHYAARYSHIDVMHVLVQNGADVNIQGDDGLTPLHYAARFKIPKSEKTPALVSTYLTDSSIKEVLGIDMGVSYKNEVKNKTETVSEKNQKSADPVIIYLLESGARVNEKDNYGLTPLHYACMRGNIEATEELILSPAINIEATDEQALTPLHLACTYGQQECARLLVQAGANIISCDERKSTALHKACSHDIPELVSLLLKSLEALVGVDGVDEVLSYTDINQQTPLQVAVEAGNIENVKILLENGAEASVHNEEHMYALHLACTVGSLDIVKILLKNEADIQSRNRKNQTALHVASAHNNPAIIAYLIGKGAEIDVRDESNNTPLLLAARKGHPDAVKVLINYGASLTLVDKEDRSCFYLAVEQNHPDVVNLLLEYNDVQQLMGLCDRWDNTPLHVACIKGFYEIAIILIEAGADISAKNEDEQTPLLVSAIHGRNRLVTKLLGLNKFAVNDEDCQSNTALHLACSHGHYEIVSTLISGDANIVARNYHLWTPLDCAAASGWVKCAKLLINARAPVDPMDKKKTTPLHLSAKFGHAEVTELLLEHGASVQIRDITGRNGLDVAIQYDNRNVVVVILESNQWESALRNEYCTNADVRETPLRLLIKKYPDLAKLVFDKCVTTNQHNSKLTQNTKTVSAVDKKLEVVMNYEFLDDTYSVYHLNQHESQDETHTAHFKVWDENGKLVNSALPYSLSDKVIKENHPLKIMVDNKRTRLLQHPLCLSLVRRKWNKFARYVFYFNVMFYSIFLACLTVYMQLSPRPYKLEDILEYSQNPNATVVSEITSNSTFLAQNRDCAFLNKYLHTKKSEHLRVTQILVMIQAIFWIVKEFLQFLQRQLNYLSWDNLMDIFCYIAGFLIVFDFDDCQSLTGLRRDWQWQLGAFTVTLAWLNFLSLLRKFPFFGIYVLMFSDVLQTFLKVSVIIALFVLAFSFGFYALVADQAPFGNGWYSIMKTFVMTIGELEYADLFFADESGGNNTSVTYELSTFAFFFVFVIIMPIIITNLLVGLAVDDIQSVQENAVLQRLAMQVELNLSVETMLPEFVRRRLLRRFEKFYPNRPRSIISRIFSDEINLTNDLTEGTESDTEILASNQVDIQRKVDSIKHTVKTMNEDILEMKGLLRKLTSE